MSGGGIDGGDVGGGAGAGGAGGTGVAPLMTLTVLISVDSFPAESVQVYVTVYSPTLLVLTVDIEVWVIVPSTLSLQVAPASV